MEDQSPVMPETTEEIPEMSELACEVNELYELLSTLPESADCTELQQFSRALWSAFALMELMSAVHALKPLTADCA